MEKYTKIILIGLIALLQVTTLYFIFLMPINITLFEEKTVYGTSTIFERIINPNCPQINSPRYFNQEPFAVSLIDCSQKIRWF